MQNELFGKPNNRKDFVDKLVNRSTKATCGTFEREVTVAADNTDKAIRRLKNSGFRVVGKSVNGGDTRKVWFVRRGLGMI